MLKRPTTIEDVGERIKNFRSKAARDAVDKFVARPTDVFISTYPKSGTTWMQQIVHQLQTGGNTDFEEISQVVPWLESAVDTGVDPEAAQAGGFRSFKCHLLYKDLPQGARYITIVRDPASVLKSFYNFFSGWWFEAGSVSIEEFSEQFYFKGTASGRHWDYLIEWHNKIAENDTLLLCYEDMLQAPDKVPRIVADFLEVELDITTLNRVNHYSSREYMVANSNQFDDHVLREHRDPVWGLPPGAEASKVVKAAHSDQLSPKIIKGLAEVWQQTVYKTLGYTDYAQYRHSLPNPLGAIRS
jgi:hypothetical protein